jgi:hypothetical protein
MNPKNSCITFVVMLTAGLVLPSHAAESVGVLVKQPVVRPSASPMSPMRKQVAKPLIHIKCPERVGFLIDVDQVPGWNKMKYVTGAKVERAQITYQTLFGKDGLQCMMGGLPVADLRVEKGSCVVGQDEMSFDCKPGTIN